MTFPTQWKVTGVEMSRGNCRNVRPFHCQARAYVMLIVYVRYQTFMKLC